MLAQKSPARATPEAWAAGAAAGSVYIHGIPGALLRLVVVSTVNPGAGVPALQRVELVARFTAAQAHMLRRATRRERVGKMLVDVDRSRAVQYAPAVRVAEMRVRALAGADRGLCDVWVATEGDPLTGVDRAAAWRRAWWALAAVAGRVFRRANRGG